MIEQSHIQPIKKLIKSILLFEGIFWAVAFLLFYSIPLVFSTKETFGFLNPQAFLLLLIIIPIYCIYIRKINWKNEQFEHIPLTMHELLSPIQSIRKKRIHLWLFRTAIVCIIIASAQPVFGKKKVASSEVKSELVLCIDISNSMNVKDISPEMSRLEIAKRSLLDLVNHLKGERVGIVVFAGNAFIQLPLTSDYSSAKTFIEEIETNMISNQGTNINEALKLTGSLFSPIDCQKRILLLTDGENHAEDPTTELTNLKEKEIDLFVMGIGTTTGGPIERNPKHPELGYLSENDQVIISKVNTQFLKSIAKTANGSAMLANTAFPDYSKLLTEINQKEVGKSRALQVEVSSEQYQWFVGLALICLMLIQLPTTKQVTIKR